MADEVSSSSSAELREELERLQRQVHAVQERLGRSNDAEPWWPKFYTAYHVMVGAVLGLAGAAVALMFNIVGSLMVGQHPLQLIRVFLTFPLGEAALGTEDGFALSSGFFLYFGAGMFFGAGLHVVLERFLGKASAAKRLLVAAGLGLALWVVNFYLILSWLQPLLFGGRWVVSEIPFWVAAATHVVFALTIGAGKLWGSFEPSSTVHHSRAA